MKPLRIKSLFVNVISTSLVLIALIGIAAFQYSWLQSSAQRDIIDLYRNLNFTIHKSLSYELSRSLFNSNKYFLNSYNGDDEKYKETIEEVFNSVNSELRDNYIRSIGFITKKNKLFNYQSGIWNITENTILDSNDHGKFIPDKLNPGKVSFIFISKGKEKVSNVIILDLYQLYKDRIEEGLNPVLEDYELKWYFDLPENGAILNDQIYNYSPLIYIKNTLLNSEPHWYIGLSLFMEAVRNKSSSDLSSENEYNFKPAPMDKQNDSYSAYVDVYFEGEPLINSKERYLTIQWLLNLLLLIGLGSSYFLILNQIRKLKMLREKEKEFVASITHELRTPLSVIHSAADNIRSGIIPTLRMEQYGDLIIDQSKRLSSMIEGVLLFSRFEGKAEKAPVLNAVESEQLKINLSQLIEVVKKDYNLELNIDLNMPKSFMCDIVSLELILTNLILNSAKHAYEFGCEGNIRLRAHLKLPNRLIFSVEDDGCGISKRERKHIFDPFYRGQRSHDNQINGSGLGLFLTSKKVKLLRGDIKLNSPYERIAGKSQSGCQFLVSIPYIKDKPEV